MSKNTAFAREGYLRENYHYFHLRDTAGQERDFHFHEFDKIVLLLSGRVDYFVESEVYALEPWSLLLVKHHTIHKALIDKSEPYDRVIIYLDRKYFERIFPDMGIMDSFDAADRLGRHLLTPTEAEREELKRCLRDYEQCEADNGAGAQALRDTLIMQLLHLGSPLAALIAAALHGGGQLVRTMADNGDAAAQSEAHYDPKIAQVMSYINENLCGELSVDVLAERVFLSKYHFMRLFKAQTGVTVHTYVRQKRLVNAARLIREGTPAAKAAADSGFTDYSAFHRAFRESFGMSPGKLKK